MESTYRTLAPNDNFQSKRMAYAGQKLLDFFEFSGVFSEALMNRVHGHVLRAIDAKENKRNEDAVKEWNSFLNLLKTYSIFSDSFVTTVSCLFQILIRDPESTEPQ